jgi:hypothetical protein
MAFCACGLHLKSTNVPKFHYLAWLYSMDRKFHGDYGKAKESGLGLFVSLAHGHDPVSGQRHDGILSIGKWYLNHFALFQLPDNWWTTKNCGPYFRATQNFQFFILKVYLSIQFVFHWIIWYCHWLTPWMQFQQLVVVGARHKQFFPSVYMKNLMR